MDDRDERAPSSEEMLRRAREEIAGRTPDGHAGDDTAPSDPTGEPPPAPARRSDDPESPLPPRRRPDVAVPVVVAAFVALIVAGVVGVILSRASDDAPSTGEAFVEGFEEGLTESMVEFGFDDAARDCVLADVRAAGVYDVLRSLDTEVVGPLLAIDPNAPLSEYPPEFRPVAEAVTEAMASCIGPTATETPGTGAGPGDDADLDPLHADCAATGAEACDLLYLVSPLSSEYERFGATCGDRNAPNEGLCLELHGDGPHLDAWRTACAEGDAGACDLLYQLSPVDSEDERFGTTCGGRDEPSPLSCWARFGPRL
ncbi:MAG: hypothetical protein R3290_04710 [Acidimicrobiia bacterium]|nr:hypothetical protein [Acidimicrobiia bacterium]